MADTELASHFEDVLDREDAPPEKPPREPRNREAEDVQPVDQDELFPQRETEGEAPDDDEEPPRREQVDEEDEEEDDRPQPEPEEEEDDQAALDLNAIVRVNVDGEPAEVSLQEALNGYVRAETFHRRLNQLQQVAQQIERERAEISQGRAYYAEMIPALHQQLLSLQPEEPNWDKLYEENPAEAARLERQWRSYREKLGQLQHEHKRVQAEQEAERVRQEAIYEDTQRRSLLQSIPDWADAKRWERDRRAMIRTAMGEGYSEKELEGLKDARATRILRKAALYDQLMANKPKPVRQQGALRPGAISSRAAPNGLARAEKRLQRSGSVRDAARAFEEDLNREG